MNKSFYIFLFLLLFVSCNKDTLNMADSKDAQSITGKWTITDMSYDSNKLEDTDAVKRLFPAYLGNIFSKENKLVVDFDSEKIDLVINDTLVDTATITRQSNITNDSLILETDKGKFSAKFRSDKNVRFTLEDGTIFIIDKQ